MRKQKKGFRFPVVVHLQEAVGALTLHTGVETQILYFLNKAKKLPAKMASFTHLLEMYYATKVSNIFLIAKYICIYFYFLFMAIPETTYSPSHSLKEKFITPSASSSMHPRYSSSMASFKSALIYSP